MSFFLSNTGQEIEQMGNDGNSTATAVWVALCGSIPIIVMTMPSS